MPIPATKYIWFNGKLVPWEKATVHVLSHALHYGSSVFEGVRAYETPRGPAIFRLRDHTRRLFDSAKIYRINIPFTRRADQSRLPRGRSRRTACARGAYLRPVAFRGYGEAGVVPEDRAAHRSGDRRAGNGASISARGRRRRRRRVRVVVAARRAEHDSRAWPRPAATTCRASSSASEAQAPRVRRRHRPVGRRHRERRRRRESVPRQGRRAVHAGHRALAAQRHHAPHRHARWRRTWASKCARSRSRARCSTSPTSCSSPARRDRSRADPLRRRDPDRQRQARPDHREAAGGLLRPRAGQDARTSGAGSTTST